MISKFAIKKDEDMGKEKVVIIMGHGYLRNLCAGTMCFIKEQQSGADAELCFAARYELAALLKEASKYKDLRRIYLVGMGMDASPEEMKMLLDEFLQREVRVDWISTIQPSEKSVQNYTGKINFVNKVGSLMTTWVKEKYGPWTGIEKYVDYLIKQEASGEGKEDAEVKLLYEMTGFVSRVTPKRGEHEASVIKEWVEGVKCLVEKKPYSLRLRNYIDKYELYGRRELKGYSAKMKELKERIFKVAAVDDVRVMILGESGTGKESVATYLHLNSKRWDKPLVFFNCASANPALLESAFLGHKKGSFTGATADKDGIFKQAHGGTLFLDEVGDLPIEAQGLLLRVLEEKRFLPLGGQREVEVNVRLITATNKNLWAMADEGKFRRDLIFRLQEFTLQTIPLREKLEDIYTIADHAWRARNNNQALPKEVEAVLCSYDWPGNVRELMNFLKYASVMGGDWAQLLQEYRSYVVRETRIEKLPENLDEMKHRHCRRILDQCGGNKSLAAEKLGITRVTLNNILKSSEK